MKSKLLLLAILAPLLFAESWEIAQPGYKFQFPRDHFSHPQYQTEWWYYTGNLRAAGGRRFGFELTFFRQAQKLGAQILTSEAPVWRPDQLYLAHFALSDIDGRSFYHSERLHRAGPGLAGASLADQRYWNGNWQVRWLSLADSRQQLTAVCERFTLTLLLNPLKPAVIQGENEVLRKGPREGQTSHYIAFTRLQASGELKEANHTHAVSGLAWMDHEFFTEPPANNLTGWDWFSIQLRTNEELMLYRMRGPHGESSPFSSGSYIDAQGKMHFLPAAAFFLTTGATWQSPHSGARYPIAWEIRVPSLNLVLHAKTDLQDQELSSANAPTYWEGAVTYSGTRRGKSIAGAGYLEMTGYRAPVNLSGMTAGK